jgi:hypothetical protein
MKRDATGEHFSPEETARRRDDAITRALSTPPKHYEQYKGKSTKESSQKPSARAKSP